MDMALARLQALGVAICAAHVYEAAEVALPAVPARPGDVTPRALSYVADRHCMPKAMHAQAGSHPSLVATNGSSATARPNTLRHHPGLGQIFIQCNARNYT